ncbi:DUF975 family protein [Ruficoccus amylovorans]|uniref:DUF975 family protein n=1 Tax=Ruficoccus amylovorans TaxID=1804625 RepID=A0A842HMN9_9BACT|nr:DUF975 family protein [Ruficoccus amylovorans]MBC2596351.1 DUF975 family protein [Ruficoccus amylovorans]
MWYYAIYNRQHGPVSPSEIERLIEQGIVTADTLVWRAGMNEWQPASRTPLAEKFPAAQTLGDLPPIVDTPSARPGYGQGIPQDRGLPPPTSFEVPAGANARALMSLASDMMSGRWSTGIGFCLIYGLVYIGIQIIPYIGGLINSVLFGVLEVGAMRFWLTYTRGGEPKTDQLFSAFPIFLKTFLTYLLYSAILVVAILVAAIPGGILLGIAAATGTDFDSPDLSPLLITGFVVMGVAVAFAGGILALMLSQVFYILADNAETGVFESLQRSRSLMVGNKWRLFRLWVLFGLLSIGCIFTLGIGFIWLVPYSRCTMTCFYESLLSQERNNA